MAAYIITRITEEAGFAGGKPAATIRVEFMVGEDGPFFQRFPKDAFTDAAAQASLASFADAIERTRRGY
jgi:hypothetical protein